MRIVDKYITEPGMVSGKIPEGCTFPQRRPDLMHLKLNEENSMQEVSYVGLAEKRMAAFLLDKDICEDAQMQELYKNMSGLFYPLELPLQIPKEKIRGYLKEKKTSLEELYEIFGVGREKVLCERMKVKGDFLDSLLSVWDENRRRQFRGEASMEELQNASEFLFAADLTKQEAKTLFLSQFTEKEKASGICSLLFINRNGKNGEVLSFDEELKKIKGLSEEVMDDIIRFLRICKMTGISMQQADWLLRRNRKKDELFKVEKQQILELEEMVINAEKYHISMEDMEALTGMMNICGQENLFDRIYNGSEKIYHPKDPEGMIRNPAWKDEYEILDITVGGFWKNHLCESLKISAEELKMLVSFLAKGKSSVSLDQEMLSALYRHTVMARLLSLGMQEYLLFLSYCGIGDKQVFTVQEAAGLLEWKSVLKANVYQMDYLLNRQESLWFRPYFTKDSFKNLRESCVGLIMPEEEAEREKVILYKLSVFLNQDVELLEKLKKLLMPVPKELEGSIHFWYEAFIPGTGEDEALRESYAFNLLEGISDWLLLQSTGVPRELINCLGEQPWLAGKTEGKLTMENLYGMYLATQDAGNYGAFYWKALSCFEENSGTFSSRNFAELTGKQEGEMVQFLEQISVAGEEKKVPLRYLHRILQAWTAMEKTGFDSLWIKNLLALDEKTYQEQNKLAEGIGIRENVEISKRKKSALLSLVKQKLHRNFPDICTTEHVYKYLLMDVSMDETTKISPVKEGLNALQLYLQRCRMGLEKGVDELEIPSAWWPWMMNYRKWEANRRIFVYPENYLLPEIRPSKTKLFQEAERNIQQAGGDDGKIEQVYLNYLEQYETLTKLKPCAAYRTETDGKDVLYLFGCTREEPLTYYYCSSTDQEAFTEWKQIDCKITGTRITPVYIFDRLHIFWIEQNKGVKPELKMKEQEFSSKEQQVYRISIYYTFLNLQENWSTPQTLLKDELVYAGKNEDVPEKPFSDAFQMNAVSWNRLMAMRFTKKNTECERGSYINGIGENEERLLLFLGGFTYHVGNELKEAIPNDMTSQDEDTFEYLERMANMKNQMNSKEYLNEAGHYLNGIAKVYNSDMEEVSLIGHEEYFLYDSYEAGLPGIAAAVDSLTGQVGIRYCSDMIRQALEAGEELLPEEMEKIQMKDVTPETFKSYTIPDEMAESIYECLIERKIIQEKEVAGQKIHVVDRESFLRMDLYEVMKKEYCEGNKKLIPSWFTETRKVLLNCLGSVRLFQREGGFQLIPVMNQPGAFLCDCGEESFLITPLEDDMEYSLMDQGVRLTGKKITYIDLWDLFLKVDTCDKFLMLLKDAGVIDKKGYVIANNKSMEEFQEEFESFFRQESVTEEVQKLLYSKIYHRQMVTSTMFVEKDVTSQQSKEFFKELTGIDPGDNFSICRLNPAEAKKKNPQEALYRFRKDRTPERITRLYRKYLSAPEGIALHYVNEKGKENKELEKSHFQVMRLTNASIRKMKNKMYRGGLHRFLTLETQGIPIIPVLPFDRYQPNSRYVIYPEALDGCQVDFEGLYREYNWELFYHIPMLVAESLKQGQNHEAAKTWIEYLFSPEQKENLLNEKSFMMLAPYGYFQENESEKIYQILAAPKVQIIQDGRVKETFKGIFEEKIKNALMECFTEGVDKEEKLLVVRNILLNAYCASPKSFYWKFRPFRHRSLETLLEDLKDGSRAMRIYNNDPFNPHGVAGLRIGAYEKYTIIEYIRNIIEWGDREFSRYTWESLTQATSLYVLAQDLLGERPGPGKAQDLEGRSFYEIKKAYASSDIPQFLIYLECALKPEEQEPDEDYDETFSPDIYFKIPENKELIQLWDLLEDRLYKIRHSMDIMGVQRSLSLYDAPVNPLLMAMAGSLNNPVDVPYENVCSGSKIFRFHYLYEHAMRLTEHLVQLGTSLSLALEKADAEKLQMLLNSQDKALVEEGRALKESQKEILSETKNSLETALESAKEREMYYSGNIEEFMSSEENAAYTLRIASAALNTVAGVMKTTSSAIHLMPQVGSPFAMKYGGVELGSSMDSLAASLETDAMSMQMTADCIHMMADYNRRRDEWELQKKMAEFDQKSLEAQIKAMELQIRMAEKELELQDTMEKQKQEVSEYLQSKFTSVQLYQWMSGKIKSTMLQIYQMALEAAMQAQLAYQEECRREDNFIRFQSWDSERCGLLTGENLLNSLLQMHHAYTSHYERCLEVEKDISLLKECPEAFFRFKQTGECYFNLTEDMFACDYPGMYMRRIKTVSVTIPALLAPYQTLCATLVQEKSYILQKPGKEEAARFMFDCHIKPENPPEGVLKDCRAGQKIAVSRGVRDMGIFDFGKMQEMYFPFEGTGITSGWVLRMPKQNNRISYENISDIIIHIQYTGLEDMRQEKLIASILEERTLQRDNLYLNMKQYFPKVWKEFLKKKLRNLYFPRI